MENDYNTRILSNRTFQHKNFIILGIIILFSSCGNSNEELNKGFDFNFGTNLTLQISIKDILKGLTNNSNNSVFNKSLVDTDNSFITSDDTYLNLFFDTFDNIKGDTKLTDPSIFLNKTTSGFIDFQMTDDEVRSVLIRKIDESIIYTIDVLKKRIDNLGVTQSKIKRVGKSGRVLIELPGFIDVKIFKYLFSIAQLEFWETYPPNNQDIASFFVSANERLKSIVDTERNSQKPSSEIDPLLADIYRDNLDSQNNPLIDLIRGQGQGYETFKFAINDTATVGSYLRMNEVIRMLPASLANVKFVWERPSQDSEVVGLYALKSNRDNTPRISGDVVSDARDDFDQYIRPSVSMNMNTKGTKEWEKLTRDAFNNQTGIAIVLDNKVYTAPGVSSGPISGGRSEITGLFTVNETKDIVNVIKTGKLPTSVEVIKIEIDCLFQGIQEGYYLKNKFGHDMVIQGNKVTIPSVVNKFLFQEDFNVKLQQSTSDGQTFYFEGTYEVLKDDEKIILIECELSDGQNSNPSIIIEYSKINNVYIVKGQDGSPDFEIKLPTNLDFFTLEFIQRSLISKSEKENISSKNNKSDNSSQSYSQNGSYSYSSGDVELSMNISGDSWTGRTKICEYCDVEYDSGIVYGSDLYDSSGSVKIGNISGNSISTSIGSSRVTLRK